MGGEVIVVKQRRGMADLCEIVPSHSGQQVKDRPAVVGVRSDCHGCREATRRLIPKLLSGRVPSEPIRGQRNGATLLSELAAAQKWNQRSVSIVNPQISVADSTLQ